MCIDFFISKGVFHLLRSVFIKFQADDTRPVFAVLTSQDLYFIL